MYVMKCYAPQEHIKVSLYSAQQFLGKYRSKVASRANGSNLKLKKKKKSEIKKNSRTALMKII